MAAPPILLDLENTELVAQATKTGQLILLNRKDGNPTEKIIEKNLTLKVITRKHILFLDTFQIGYNIHEVFYKTI